MYDRRCGSDAITFYTAVPTAYDFLKTFLVTGGEYILKHELMTRIGHLGSLVRRCGSYCTM